MTILDDTEKAMHAMVAETMRGWRDCEAKRLEAGVEIARLKRILAEVAEDRDARYRDAVSANKLVLELQKRLDQGEFDKACMSTELQAAEDRAETLSAELAKAHELLNRRVDALDPENDTNEEAAQ